MCNLQPCNDDQQEEDGATTAAARLLAHAADSRQGFPFIEDWHGRGPRLCAPNQSGVDAQTPTGTVSARSPALLGLGRRCGFFGNKDLQNPAKVSSLEESQSLHVARHSNGPRSLASGPCTNAGLSHPRRIV